ncbi:MAG: hydrogenase maturation protease [Spirochaetes bacterium]|nr:MAG: hydrogenase maturation protease [Spirochaetota bacterium]
MKTVLILGIGNTLMSDDGIGVYIVNRIIETGVALPRNVDVLDGGTAGFDLVPYMQGYDRIIIVDALKAEDDPGSIYRFPADHARFDPARMSLHEVGIAEILRHLSLSGCDPEVEIVGVVPEDVATFDISISASVLESVPRAIDVILEAARQ